MGIHATDELIIDCQKTFGANYAMFVAWLMPWRTKDGKHIIPCTEEYYYQMFMEGIDEDTGKYYESLNT